jgi:photosystem II stability/assembly factor-like uncharacterized protein
VLKFSGCKAGVSRRQVLTACLLISGLTMALSGCVGRRSSTAHRPSATDPRSKASRDGCRNVQLNSFHFVSSNVGWAQGSCASQAAILRTTDGGRSWRNVAPESIRHHPEQALGAEFLDETHVWVAGHWGKFTDAVFETSDGGTSWRHEVLQVADAHSYPPDFANPYFLDEQQGWIATKYAGMHGRMARLYRTSNGGANWVQVASELPISGLLGFQTATLGYAELEMEGGGQNVVYRSSDGGRHWSPSLLPLPVAYRRVHVSVLVAEPQMRGVGSVTLPALVTPLDLGSPPSLIVYRTRDEGVHWSPGAALLLPSSDSRVSVAFANVDDGLAITSRGVYRTGDAGVTWNSVATKTLPLSVSQVDLVTREIAFVLVWDKNGQSLKRTDDGGKTWTTEEQMPG